MTTLTEEPCAAMVRRLFADAGASEARLEAHSRTQAVDELADLMNSSDYRALYGALKEFPLAVSTDAAALRDTDGGRLISTEFEPAKVERALANLATAGLASLVEIRTGDALDTLAGELPEPIDSVFLDGAKALYVTMLAMLGPRLRSGSVVLADNADWSPEYRA